MIPSSREAAAQRAFSATIGRGAASLAVVGVAPEAEAGLFAEAVAAAGAAFGRRILLLRTLAAGGEILDGEAEAIAAAAGRAAAGHFVLDVAAGCELHRIVNDTRRLRAVLEGLRTRFDAVVLDCPPFGAVEPALYTPLAAAATEAVLLVALPAVTPGHVFDAVQKWLAESGASIAAVALNDRFNPTLAQELVREAERAQRFAPFLPDFVRRRIAPWGPLNRYH